MPWFANLRSLLDGDHNLVLLISLELVAQADIEKIQSRSAIQGVYGQIVQDMAGKHGIDGGGSAAVRLIGSANPGVEQSAEFHVVRATRRILEVERAANLQIVAAAAVELITARAANQDASPAAADQVIVAVATRQDIAPVPTLQSVVSQTAEHEDRAGDATS